MKLNKWQRVVVAATIVLPICVGYRYEHDREKFRALGRCQLSGEKIYKEELDKGDFHFPRWADHVSYCMAAVGFELHLDDNSCHSAEFAVDRLGCYE